MAINVGRIKHMDAETSPRFLIKLLIWPKKTKTSRDHNGRISATLKDQKINPRKTEMAK